jgi:hypothetical protein
MHSDCLWVSATVPRYGAAAGFRRHPAAAGCPWRDLPECSGTGKPSVTGIAAGRRMAPWESRRCASRFRWSASAMR